VKEAAAAPQHSDGHGFVNEAAPADSCDEVGFAVSGVFTAAARSARTAPQTGSRLTRAAVFERARRCMGQELPWHSPPAPFRTRQQGIESCVFSTASAGSAPDRTQSSSAAVRIDLTALRVPCLSVRACRKTLKAAPGGRHEDYRGGQIVVRAPRRGKLYLTRGCRR
jgi:hypothetical protein